MIWPFKKSEPKVIIKEIEKKVYVKGFNAAKIDRLNEDFRIAVAKINEDIRNSLTNLRGRSRTLSQNNDYYIRALNLWCNYVVGPQGQTLVSRVKDSNGKNDKDAMSKIEMAWKDFCKKKNFTLNKRLTFHSFQHYCAYSFARDGEVFIEIIEGADNKHGITFQVIDPDFLDEADNVDLLDNGNHVCQGIEIDRAGNVVGYRFKDPSEVISNYGIIPKGGKKIFKSADKIIHWYNKIECNQYRGFPVFQNLLIALFGLSELNESEMISFRAASCKMGFIEQEFPDEFSGFGNVKDGDGNYIDEIQAGLVQKLNRGEKFVGYNPDHKSGNWETFSRGILRSAASGSGFPYCLLSNDYTGMDADSIRLQMNDARDFAITKQKQMCDDLIDPIFESWLPFGLLTQTIPLPLSKIDKFSDREFRGRPFQSLRPLEEAQANQIMWENGGNSRTNYHRGLNLDTDDIFAELGYEEELSSYYNIPLRNQGGTMADNIGKGDTKNAKE